MHIGCVVWISWVVGCELKIPFRLDVDSFAMCKAYSISYHWFLLGTQCKGVAQWRVKIYKLTMVIFSWMATLGVEIDEAHLEHPYALLLQPMSQYQV